MKYLPLGMLLVVYLASNSVSAKPSLSELKLENGFITERDLQSTDGKYFLSISTGTWDTGGYLVELPTQNMTMFDGKQKGKTLTLKSFDSEKGADAPSELLLTGDYDPANNTFTGKLTHVKTTTTEKIQFIPAIKINNRPQFNFKYLGTTTPTGYNQRITQIQVFNQNNQLVQTLSGFSANTYHMTYADYNFDGYFDLQFDDSKSIGDDHHFQIWLYEPKTGKFKRNLYLESFSKTAISGISRYPFKHQLYMGNKILLEMQKDGHWKQVACCHGGSF